MKLQTSTVFLTLVLGSLSLAGPLQAQAPAGGDPALWPEPDRAFFQDGPALLLTPEQRTELLGLDAGARTRWIDDFIDRDPIPETPANELREGIERRQTLAYDANTTPRDVRSQILFLNGPPFDRLVVDCGSVFKPLEIWTYHHGISPDGKPVNRQLLVYARAPGEPYRLWLPSDSKRPLYTPLMEYWLQQWEELRGRIRAVRFDLQNCKEAKNVDEATGVPGLTGALTGGGVRIRPKDASPFLAPPADLAGWAREAAATELPPLAVMMKGIEAAVRFPAREGQRVVARTLVTVPANAGFQVDSEGAEIRLVVEGLVEQEDKPFEDFRMRFRQPAPKAGESLVLAIDRALRPRANYVLRLKIKDEVSGAEAWLTRGFRVPEDTTGGPAEPSPAGSAKGELVPVQTAAGEDSLILLPPTDDILMGLWRADTIVTGERIQKVAFLVDGKPQLTSSKRPFTAEVRLERYPTEQSVRVEGYDAEGKLVSADEVVINQPRGSFNVRIVSPPKGTVVKTPSIRARAEIVVPDGRKVTAVELRVNDETVASLTRPPWEAEVKVPEMDLVYLTVQATLDDGGRAEAVRYLRAPQFVSEVDVNLVELYVAVTDHAGNPVGGFKQEDFEVTEAGKPQEIVKFELVQELPMAVGMLIDTSGSMAGSLAETQGAATGFLESVLTPRDKAFAVSFARKPRLEMPPTDDAGAVIQAIKGLQAVGDTALHDALVHSLYYFRGMPGQRALVLLSDGEDNASYMSFNDAMEYARRSGVAVYAIGLNLSAFETGIRSKLSELASATGGRAFFTSKAEELPAVYKQIESELRSRYLVAYNSTDTSGQTGFRPVEVKVKRSGLKVRTARGYYP